MPDEIAEVQTMTSDFTSFVSGPPMVLADLGEELAKVGVDLSDVRSVRLDARCLEDAVWAEVVTYCRNEHGQRYFDKETQKAAQEVRRFRVAAMTLVPKVV